MSDRRFEQLVRDHHRAVRTYASSMVSRAAHVDDVVQETFLRAWKYFDSFRGEGSFEGWLIRICRNCVIDLEAGERRRPAVVATMPEVPQPPDERSETMAVVASLPPEQREVLVLVGMLGYDYDSAAAVLEVPVGTVRSRLHRGRSALDAALRQPDDGEVSA